METPLEAVRKRPGMYVGDTANGSGIVHMVLEVLANAYDQYLVGRCTRINITIAADGTATVEDDGPGMLAHGDDRLPPLELLLTKPSDRPTIDGHRPHAHLGVGGLGLFVVNALSDRFELVTVREGVEARTTYAYGSVIEPLTTAATQRSSGTIVRFRPDATIFPHVRAPRAELTTALEDLSFLAPDLQLCWSYEGDDIAAHGLVGLVALRAPCTFEEVAHHRARYETPKGPIDVEVALAWRRPHPGSYLELAVDSFVNLGRTRGDGAHVDGLLDAVRKFIDRPDIEGIGIVAAVGVVLADVIYGNPTKDRLDSPEARGPVAEAMQTALGRWASACPELVSALRRHVESNGRATRSDS